MGWLVGWLVDKIKGHNVPGRIVLETRGGLKLKAFSDIIFLPYLMLFLICTEWHTYINHIIILLAKGFKHVALQFTVYGPTTDVIPIAVCSHSNCPIIFNFFFCHE